MKDRTATAAVSTFSSVLGVPVRAVNVQPPETKVPSRDQIPAAPTGLAVGTSPPSLPTEEDQRCEREGKYVPSRN